MSITERVFEQMRAKGLNKNQLAVGTGISPGLIQQWDKGDKVPGRKSIAKVSSFLCVPQAYFLGETDDPTPPNKKESASLTERQGRQILDALQDAGCIGPDGPTEKEVKAILEFIADSAPTLKKLMNKDI